MATEFENLISCIDEINKLCDEDISEYIKELEKTISKFECPAKKDIKNRKYSKFRC